jgi:hypothetical protein
MLSLFVKFFSQCSGRASRTRQVELWPRPERGARHAKIPVHAAPVGQVCHDHFYFVLRIFKEVIKSENAAGLAAQKTESYPPRTALHFLKFLAAFGSSPEHGEAVNSNKYRVLLSFG